MTPGAQTVTVGIIGVGRMGQAVAELLVRRGYRVLGYRRGAMTEFIAAGGIAMPDPVALTVEADHILLLLPNATATLEVADRIAPVLDIRKTVLCCATLPLADKAAVAALLGPTGAAILDAELSGTPEMLKQGKASAIVAGDRRSFDRVEAVVGAFTAAVHFAGAFGNAVKLKLITNYLVAVHTFATAEALQMARAFGLDLGETVDWVGKSAAASTMFAVRGPIMAERREVAGNSAAFLNYFDLLNDVLHEHGIADVPLLDVTRRWFRRSVDLGFSARGIAGLYESLDSVFEIERSN